MSHLLHLRRAGGARSEVSAIVIRRDRLAESEESELFGIKM
ncbi:hypothetical protein [Microbacterium sp. K24]|nr:hypothetical protein [Microbacterium sp. K24]